MTANDPQSLAGQDPARKVLIVDDSRAQRRVLAMQLMRWGYRVHEAASGEEALTICADTTFDLVLSDWMMPGMSGIDFCREFKKLPRESYGYFILLTSKSEKAEIANGLEGGADDFLAKPVHANELRARLRAGERILLMQAQLVEKNRVIGQTLDQLQRLYDSLDRDLIEARKLQQTLVRDRRRDYGAAAISILLRPSGHVGGDLAGSFPIGSDRIAVYSVDVSGHGVASAMMTARIAGLLSGASSDHNIALEVDSRGERIAWPPEEVAARLNRLMLNELKVDQYFTMAYAEVDLASGAVSLVQAGHPNPLLLRQNGTVLPIGGGGLPIGLIEDAHYSRIETRLHPGDRLFLMSDGLIECPDPHGTELGLDGLIALVKANRRLASPALLEALVWDLSAHAGSTEFPDDVSGIAVDYRGPA